MTSRPVRTATLAALAALSLGAAAAVPAGAAPTGEAAVPSCGTQCITQATVDATASGATVRVVTSAPAGVTVRISPAEAPLEEAAGPSAPGGISNLALLTDRSFTITPLEPDTEYRIVVEARDGYGATSTRIGTFRTRAVETAVEPPATGLVAPGGCGTDCLTRAVAVNSRDIAGRTRFTIETQVPARIGIELVRRSADGAVQERRRTRSAPGVLSFAPVFNGLAPGSRYEATVTATDAAGEHRESGTFRTADAVADITFHRIQIVEDGDPGPNRGEVLLWLKSAALRGGHTPLEKTRTMTWAKRSAGDLVAPPASARMTLPVEGDSGVSLALDAHECDARRLSGCHVGLPSNEQASAGAGWTLSELRRSAGLPPWYGTGVAPPPGRHFPVMFQDLSGRLQFRVLALVALRVVS